MKTMNNNMAKNANLSTFESKKQTKQTRRTETESRVWRAFFGCQMGGGFGVMGEEVRGLRTNR